MEPTITIYSIAGEAIATAIVTQEAVIHEELMTSDYVKLSWSSPTGETLPAGAYIEHDGERYSLLEPYAPQAESGGEYRYEPEFQSRVMAWGKQVLPLYTYEEDGKTVKTREMDWDFTGSPADAMYMVEQAIRNETGEEWQVELSDSLPATITISSQSGSILSALNEIASECETEWWADKATNTLYLSRCQRGEPVALTASGNVGVPSVTEAKDGYYTRFYVFGSTRNVTQDSGSAATNSVVNKRLTLDPATYPGGYIDAREGLLPGEIFTAILTYDDIYPSSRLEIGDVRARLKYRLDSSGDKIETGADDEGNPVYEQYAIWYFQLPGLDFDPDTIIPQKTLSVHFESGQLAGRDFELAYHEKASQVKDAADVAAFQVKAGDYEIIIDESEGMILPGLAYIIPQDGDKATLYNIEMPAEYTSAAQAELAERALKDIAKRMADNRSYEMDSNPVAFKEDGTVLSVGQAVSYAYLGVILETRVLMVERHLDFPWQAAIRVGNELIKGNTQQLKEEVTQASQNIDVLKAFNELSVSLSNSYANAMREMQEGFARIGNMWRVDPDRENTIYSDFNAYVKGWLSAKGANDTQGEGGGGGGVSYSRLDTWEGYTDEEKGGWVLSAYLGVRLHQDIENLKNGVAMSYAVTGTGNAITDVTRDGSRWVFTKGKTFSELVHTHPLSDISNLHSSWDAVLKAQKPNWLTAVSLATIGDLHANWDAILKVAPSDHVTRWPTAAEVGALTQTTADGRYALKTVTISAGAGLTGGGNLSANRTLSLAAVGTAGTYTKVTVDAYGRVTAHASLSATDIPTLSISKISGLQAALDKKLPAATFDELFEKVTLSTGETAIRAKLGLYSDKWLSAKGANPNQGEGGGFAYTRLDTWEGYTDEEKGGWVLSAYLGVRLHQDIENLKNGVAMSYAVTGTGNAITDVTRDGSRWVFTKGKTFSELVHTHPLSDISNLHSSWDAVLKAQKPNWLTAVSLATIGDLHANWDAILKVAPSDHVTRWPTAAEVGALTQTTADGRYALKTVTISAGAGLTGGGNLSANRTLSLAAVGTAGTYTKVTVDAYGRVTAHASLSATDIPTLSISKISGLQAALDKKLPAATFDELFEKVTLSTGETAIRAKLGLYSDKWLSAKGANPNQGEGGGFAYTRLDTWEGYDSATMDGWVLSAGLGYSLYNDVKSLKAGAAVSFTIQGTGNAITDVSKSGTALVFTRGTTFALSSHQHPLSDISNLHSSWDAVLKAQKPNWLTSVSLATISDLHSSWDALLKAAPSAYVTRWPSFSEVTSKPTTLGGYGITDAALKDHTHSQYLTGITKSMVEAVLTGNITSHTHSQYLTSVSLATITDLHSSWDAVLKAQKPNWLTSVSLATISDLHSSWDALLKAAPSAYVTRWPTAAEVGALTQSTADGRYVNITGDTMTGALNFANNTWNKVGGDAYIGDINVAGQLGIKAANTTNPGIAFYNNSNSSVGSLLVNGRALQWRGNTLWHAGNDGSGSRLDADLLDGTHKSGLFTAFSANGNSTRLTIGGVTKDLTVPYAKNCDTLDGLHGSSFMACNGLNGISLTGGNGNTGGYRLVIQKTMTGWSINNLVFVVASRHNGQGILSVAFHITANSPSSYSYSIRYFGANLALNAPFRAFYNTSTYVFRLYWHYSDSASTAINVLRVEGFPSPSNGTWYEAMPSDNGTELTIEYNNADTIGGTSKGGLLTALSSSSGTNLSLTVGGTTKTVADLYATAAEKLLTARTINGTSFNGTANIVTSYWGTARNIAIASSNGGGAGAATSVNGSANVTLKLPATITAALIGNASTASKLQTARTLWGRSFDGSANVSGDLSGVGSISATGNHTFYNTTNGGVLLCPGINSREALRIDRASNTGGRVSNMMTIYFNGNVGIGTISPSYKLHVAGTGYFSGTLHASGGIYSDGYVSAKGQNTSSDMRLKDVLGSVTLPLERIAKAPSFEFRWRDGSGESAGSSAQYWKEALPSAVRERGGYLEMQYGNIALISAIAIARETMRVDREVTRLREECRRLRGRVARLEGAAGTRHLTAT